MVTHVAPIFPLSLSSNSINRKNYTLTQVLTISLPFLLRLDRRIPDQNTAKRLELPHEVPPYWILLPTMHFKPTGIERCEGLWVGKLLAQNGKEIFQDKKILRCSSKRKLHTQLIFFTSGLLEPTFPRNIKLTCFAFLKA